MAIRRSRVEGPLALRSPFLIAAFRLYLRWYFWRKFHAVRLSRNQRAVAARRQAIGDLLQSPVLVGPGGVVAGPAEAFSRQARLRADGRGAAWPLPDVSPHGNVRHRRWPFRCGYVFCATALAGLAERHTLLCITAEGSFTDGRVRPVILRPGLAHLARRMPGAVFLPLALEYCFWNESRPECAASFRTTGRQFACT